MANLSNINGKFVVEQTTGYVGVGTTDPSYPIEVLNASAEIALNASGASIYRLKSDSTDYFRINKNGVGDKLVISGGGDVGIGISVPTTKLHIGGTAPGDSIIRQDSTVSGTNWEIGERAAGKWQIFEDDGDTIVATFMSSGNVGIGTDSPDAILNISKTSFSTTFTSADSYIRIGKGENATNGYQFIGFGYNNGSADLVPAYIGYQQTGTPGNYTKGDLVFGTRNVTTNTAPTERMRIDSSGNIGIGMSPVAVSTYKVLQLNGTTGNGGYIRFYSDNSNLGGISQSTAGMVFVSEGSTYYRFVSNSLERMRITSGGQVQVGYYNTARGGANTTFMTGKSGTTYLELNGGDTSGEGGILFADGSGGNYGLINYSHVSDIMQFYTASAQRMRIDSGGSIIIGDGATSGTPAADYRSLEIGRQGNTITGAPWKSNLYFSTNATITAGSTAFTYRYANKLPTKMTMEEGIFTFNNAVAGTVGSTISFTERMKIAADGFGYFYNNFYLASASNQGNLFFGTADNQYNIFGGGTYGYMGYNTGGYHRFLVNGSNRLQLEDSEFKVYSTAGLQVLRLTPDYVQTGRMPIKYPYYRVDSFKSDGSGYFWAFGHEKSDGTQSIGMMLNDGVSGNKYTRIINTLEIASFTSNEYNGAYPSFQTNVVLRNSGTSYLNGGDVLIGTTVKETQGITLYGTGANGFYIKTTGTCGYLLTNSGTVGGTTGNFLTLYNNNVGVGSIVLNGANNVVYNTVSDYRLKEDLKDFAGLDMVSKIPVYDYAWKSDGWRSYGVMAHELQEVLPQAVTGEKDAEEMQGVDYSKIVPLLVKSIQELKAEIEILKNK